MGLVAFFVLNYAEALSRPYMACWMRSVDDPLVAGAPLFQPVRGVVFALAFFPLRESLFGRRQGGLILWRLLGALGIFSTSGPAPGSFEGFIFTMIPPLDQMRGWIEVVPRRFCSRRFCMCGCNVREDGGGPLV